LQPLQGHVFRLALDYEVASLNIGVPRVHGHFEPEPEPEPEPAPEPEPEVAPPRQQQQMQQKMQEMTATMAGQAAPVESTGNAVTDARAKRRAQGNDEWEGGTGATASKTDLNQLRVSMKELEKTVMDVKAELEEERRARKLLEQKLKVGGFSSRRRREDAWQRAKSAAARQVPAPGSHAVPVPGQAPTRAAPPRPVAAVVSIRRSPFLWKALAEWCQADADTLGCARPAQDSFEARNIEKDDLLKNLQLVVSQVKDHMSKAKERGVTLGDDSTDSDIGKIIRQSFCDALVPILNYGFRSFKLVSAARHSSLLWMAKVPSGAGD
jgi:hypothetical protein